ncbi:MAG: hypothetical protein AAGG07_13905 [Planctomycetota bacterium]
MSLISPSPAITRLDAIVPAAITLRWHIHEPNDGTSTLSWSMTRSIEDRHLWDAQSAGPAGTRTARVSAEHDAVLGLLHLDSEESGLLRASLRLKNGNVRLLYARTSMIEALRVPGGRAELASPDVTWGGTR